MNGAEQPIDKTMKLYLSGAVLAVLGIALSVYSIFHHIELRSAGATDALCNINQTFNCDDIAKSPYAEIKGFPLGIFGFGYFGGMLLLLATAFFKQEFEKDNLKTYHFLAWIGLAVSIVLFAISWFSLGTICPTCVVIYLVCILQVVLVFVFRDALPKGFEVKALTNGASYPVVALAVAAIVYSFAKPISRDFPQDLPQMDIAKELSKLEGLGKEIPVSKSPYTGLGEDYRHGSDDAKIIIVEFADYQCPACRAAYKSLKEIKNEFGAQVLVVFRNFPLDNACNKNISRKMHEFACDAAIMTRCAGRIGKFWQAHDRIFEGQTDISKKNLDTWMKEPGLSDADLNECRNSADIIAKIKDDIDTGEKVGVSGTPALSLNGVKLPSPDVDELRAIIQQQLGQSP